MGSLVEELRQGLRNSEGTGILQEDPQSQLTRTFGGLPETEPSTEEYSQAGPSLPTYVADVLLGLRVVPPTTGAGPYSDSVVFLWILFPQLDCIV